jgi:hypothetical protein
LAPGLPGGVIRTVTYEEIGPVLQAVGVAGAADEVLELATLGSELNLSEDAARERLHVLEACGLIFAGLEDGLPPILRNAGRQYLALQGSVDRSVLQFLAQVIDDLHARRALPEAGTIVVDEFRAAILEGRAVAHGRGLVPEAFAPAVTDRIGIDLFAASIALMARLSDNEPAGCVAEEIVAVTLLDEARTWLLMQADRLVLTAEEARAAAEELRGLFELFQDDDVLGLFDMREPADAAVAGQSLSNIQLGVVDQRIEAWFRPFGGTIPTGYLSEPPETAEE